MNWLDRWWNKEKEHLEPHEKTAYLFGYYKGFSSAIIYSSLGFAVGLLIAFIKIGLI